MVTNTFHISIYIYLDIYYSHTYLGPRDFFLLAAPADTRACHRSPWWPCDGPESQGQSCVQCCQDAQCTPTEL